MYYYYLRLYLHFKTKKKEMSKQMKFFAIVTITMLLAILVVQLFIKDKIVLEDSQGNDLAGFGGKIGVSTEDLEKLPA